MTLGEWDTSQGLASAVGGQDIHALQFTGSEVQPGLSGSAVVLKQDGGRSGIWTSHPSAIGYRRQGYVTGGSHGGSGSMTVTIAAVAPEFDSGMNSGADQDEMERLENFGQGAQENPLVAQLQLTQRRYSRRCKGGGGWWYVSGRYAGSVARTRKEGQKRGSRTEKGGQEPKRGSGKGRQEPKRAPGAKKGARNQKGRQEPKRAQNRQEPKRVRGTDLNGS